MKRALVLVAVCLLAAPSVGSAAVSCPLRTPAAITAAAPGSVKCQKTIAKQGEKFVKTKMKAFAKCLLKNPPGSCPDTKALDKINGAILKAAEKIGAECGSDSVQGGLATSYSDLTDDTVITSCLLSQHNVGAEWVVRNAIGVSTEDSLLLDDDTNKERAGCIKELAKTGPKFVQKVLKNANKCILKQMKDQTGGDLAPICVGQFDGVAFSPSDAKTDLKQEKVLTKTLEKIATKCGALSADEIETMFGCAGSRSVEDLQECVLCGGWNVVLDLLEEQHSENGVYLANGPGVLQAAVGTGTAQAAAVAGTKFLVEGPGTYQEEVTIFEGGNDIAIVGCGGATDERPLIIPPVTQISGRGFQASRVDGLRFQSLAFFDQNNDHIRVALAEGSTFRDIVGDGDRNTAYAVFPILSNNVLVELCKVEAQNDAPIYVGQSSTITVRHNEVRDGVAGIEIENSSNANVHNNYGTGNTAGMLIFRDGSLPEDRSDCHDIHHNVLDDNNEPNFGAGTVAGVPRGIGMLVISNHSSPIHHNVTRDNGTCGIVLVDEVIAEFGPPFSPIQELRDNYFFYNVMTDNGGDPEDNGSWPLGGGLNFVLLPSESSGNCENGNIFATDIGFNLFATNTSPHFNDGTCVLPPPAVFPGCPGTPIDTDQ